MKTKKTTKPAYTVNMSDIETLDDIDVVFALAKQDAHLPLSDDELLAICRKACDIAAPKITIVNMECDCKRPKLPWYKRLWRWLMRKK